jgi:starvation-inducible outer membrane lipoprotein
MNMKKIIAFVIMAFSLTAFAAAPAPVTQDVQKKVNAHKALHKMYIQKKTAVKK